MPAVEQTEHAAKAAPVDALRRWTRALPHREREHLFHLPGRRTDLGPYYLTWDPARGSCARPPSVHALGRTERAEPGLGAHPMVVAETGLVAHERWAEAGGDEARETFLAAARWLRDRQIERLGVPGTYPIALPWDAYGAEPGWLSATVQGEAISCLLRAEEAQPHEGFAQAAIRAAEPFRRGLANGGVVSRLADGGVFLEQVATEPAAHCLGGGLIALFGLYDLLRRGGEPWARALFDESVATLGRLLPRFDAGYWSYRTLLASPHGRRQLATPREHAFHVAELRVLCAMTGDGYFGGVAGDWSEYRRNTVSRLRMLAGTAWWATTEPLMRDGSVAGGAHAVV